MSPRLEIASRLLAGRELSLEQINAVLHTANVLIEADRIFGFIMNKTPLCEEDRKLAESVGLAGLMAEPPATKPPAAGPTSMAVCTNCGERSRMEVRRDRDFHTVCSACGNFTTHTLTPDPS